MRCVPSFPLLSGPLSLGVVASERVLFMGQIELLDICLCLLPDRTWHKVNDPKGDYSGDLGEAKVGHKSRLEPCWSSTNLVQCGPDEPNWTWTQIWVQVSTLAYSLNWTARSSAIPWWQRCQWYSSPTQRGPSRSRRPFGLKSAMELWPSGTDAKQASVLDI